MTITKTKEGSYQVYLRFTDTHETYRRRRKTYKEASELERDIIKRHNLNKPVNPKKEVRSMVDLVELWYKYYGITLKDGENRKNRLIFSINLMGNPRASQFNERFFIEFREKRLTSGKTKNTTNRDLEYFKALFNKLIELKIWLEDNPIADIKKFKIEEFEAAYLSKYEIKNLLSTITGDAEIITRICLSTGARWSEAEKLKASQVKDGKVFFYQTKNANARAVPISESLRNRIFENRSLKGPLFKPSMETFRSQFPKAGITLPKGQLTHVLRHSFAVHYMLNEGDVFELQKILGHKSLKMTLRYAKFHPDYLLHASSKNPLAGFGLE